MPRGIEQKNHQREEEKILEKEQYNGVEIGTRQRLRFDGKES